MKRWEAKDMGCGQLVFELARQLETVDPGDRLEVITHADLRDPKETRLTTASVHQGRTRTHSTHVRRVAPMQPPPQIDNESMRPVAPMIV
jgi:hypothetical protein